MNDTTQSVIDGTPIERSAWGRLVNGQVAIDFVGKRRYGFLISAALVVASLASFLGQGLSLGIDFEGGISWDVPAAEFTVDDAEQVLSDNGVSTEGIRLQRRESESGEFIKVQVGDESTELGDRLRSEFADAAGVDLEQVNVNLVSSSWGSEITGKALRALVIFTIVVAIFISIRFEWRMALAAIGAMLHDVVIAVGIYSMFQFVVTPATVIAFLTILGYSLYDTIVVFDRIRENEARFAAKRPPYDDLINTSMNQVLMRTLMTSFSSVIPVLSLLLVGAGILGATTLSEFALALLIGMLVGAYSSLLVAAPALALLKRSDKNWKGRSLEPARGEVLRRMVMGGDIGSRRTRQEAAGETDATPEPVGADVAVKDIERPSAAGAEQALKHPPRPRKKKRR